MHNSASARSRSVNAVHTDATNPEHTPKVKAATLGDGRTAAKRPRPQTLRTSAKFFFVEWNKAQHPHCDLCAHSGHRTNN